MVLRKSFYIRWSAGRSPRVHEVNPGRNPSNGLYPGYNLVVPKVKLCSTQSSKWLYPRFNHMVLVVY